MNRTRGIALIDLLVLVALISVLAAVFIPQFAAYAVRTYNAAAISDLRNAVAAQESLRTEYGTYGMSVYTMLPGWGGAGLGAEISGPLPPATSTMQGGNLTSGPAMGPPQRPIVGIGISVSSDVSLRADSLDFGVGPLAGYSASYFLTVKHMMSDTAFGAEAEAWKSVFICRNSSAMWVGTPGLMMIDTSPVTEGPDLNASACGGMEIPIWTSLQ